MNNNKNLKIIFLDIDGVLNVIPEKHDKFGGIFHQHFVDNLKHIIDSTNAKIVISSTWRLMGLTKIIKMWKSRQLPGIVIDITPLLNNKTRGEEIEQWLSINLVAQYVIIDDDTDMLDCQLNNFVRTSDNEDHEDCIDIGYGLTKICAEKAIQILNTTKNNETKDKLCLGYWKPYKIKDKKTYPKKYDKYFVCRKDGKIHQETWNNTGWAYNNKSIIYWAEIISPLQTTICCNTKFKISKYVPKVFID